jgi:hypothetical protein
MPQLPTLQDSDPKKRMATVLGLPACNALLKISLGTVMTPAGLRKHLQGTLDERRREEARKIVVALKGDLVPTDAVLAQEQRFALIGQMLLAYPSGDASVEATMARGATYLGSLDDIPPWALQDAIDQWNRGKAGNENYAFMPPPAVLRRLALAHMAVPQLVVDKLQQLLDAAPSYEAALSEKTKPSRGVDSDTFKPLFAKAT